jgi:hypothetical protein
MSTRSSTLGSPAPRHVAPVAIVPLFKEQPENESQAMATSAIDQAWRQPDLVVLPETRRAFPADTEEIVCDGYNDLGIDALWIDEDGVVHFCSFKNPQNMGEPFPPGDVDKLPSGLTLILSKRADKIANPRPSETGSKRSIRPCRPPTGYI